MTRMTALASCRYYHGEKDCPYLSQHLQTFWTIESAYVNGDGKTFAIGDEHYRGIGGKDFPGIPRALLIEIFCYWSNGAYDAKAEIKNFYSLIDEYLEVVSEYFPKNKVPNVSK